MTGVDLVSVKEILGHRDTQRPCGMPALHQDTFEML
jgi:hypothetical protein